MFTFFLTVNGMNRWRAAFSCPIRAATLGILEKDKRQR